MNPAQERFTQAGLIVLALVLYFISWKFLEPDSYWIHWPSRIVIGLSDGQEFGFESRLGDRNLSIILGFVLPVILIGAVIFLKLGKSAHGK